MTTADTKMVRGKKERFLRYILRRKPCGYILLGNIITFIILGACLGALIWVTIHYSGMNKEYAREAEILKQHWSNNFTFNHCHYKSPDEAKWNTDFCASNCGSEAFAFRQLQLDPLQENEPSCIDLIDMAPCHLSFSHECVKPRNGSSEMSPALTSCYGFQNVPMSSYLTKQNPHAEATMVNAITNEELKKHMHQVLWANELIVRCPQCRIVSTPFYDPSIQNSDANSCYRVLKTMEKGWPSFASLCDPTDKIRGNRLDSILNPLGLSATQRKSFGDVGNKGEDVQEMDDICVAVQLTNSQRAALLMQ